MVKKLYLLIFILLLFCSFINVYADELDYYSNNIHKSSDVTGWDLVSDNYTYIEPLNPSAGIYEIPCNVGTGAYGCGITFDTGIEFKSGYYYSVKVYIGLANNSFVRTNTYFNPAIGNFDYGAIWNSYYGQQKLSLFTQYADSSMYYFTTPDYDTYSGNTLTYIFKLNNDTTNGDIFFAPILAEASTDRIYFYGSITESLGSDLSTAELERILGQSSQVIINQNEQIINQNQANSDKLDETNDKLNNIDDTLNNTNIDDPNFEEFEEYISENGVITQLITLPVRLYTQILNSINTSCTPFVLGDLFGYTLTMDCINPSNFFGSVLWNTIDILGTGLFIYVISKKMILVFHKFTNLEEGDILD